VGGDQADAPRRAALDPRDQPTHGPASQDDPAGAGGGDAARVFAARAASKLDPFKDWICEQLRSDPSMQSLRLREMATELGYRGGKTIFDDFVREVRPRFQVRRTFQRTIYRPGELVQCDLWEFQPAQTGHFSSGLDTGHFAGVDNTRRGRRSSSNLDAARGP
jgi:hypothetical protein